jgi:hypothetical protein
MVEKVAEYQYSSAAYHCGLVANNIITDYNIGVNVFIKHNFNNFHSMLIYMIKPKTSAQHGLIPWNTKFNNIQIFGSIFKCCLSLWVGCK